MYFRLFLGTVVLGGALSAKEADDNAELLAKKVTKNGTVAYAKDDVLVHSKKYTISADRAYYDYNTSEIELFGDITIMENEDFSSKSEYTKLNMDNGCSTSKPFFAYTGKEKVWVKANMSEQKGNDVALTDSIISSCNVQDPDWKIDFSSGVYDKESKWVELYNPVFYAGDTAVGYLPYFAFPADNSRRTGLLRSFQSYGSEEGFSYTQPIFIAPEQDWDLEIAPQIRTERGKGISSIFRFEDSEYSYGEIAFGHFRNDLEYYEDEGIRNRENWGYSFRYDRENVFADALKEYDVRDGLLLDFEYMNDTEYKRIFKETDTLDGYDSLADSRLNYYMTTDKNYLGLYGNYYKDLSKTDNDSTMQELPTLQYHSYTDTLFDTKNLYYTFDTKTKNYVRDEGFEATTYEASMPIGYHKTFFDDFLHFKFEEHIEASKTEYDNLGSNYDDINGSGDFAQNYHKFSLYTELAKPYENFAHTMILGVDYTSPGDVHKDGYFADFMDVKKEEESTDLKLVQYFYDNNGEKRVRHAVKQKFQYSKEQYKYGTLENDLKVYFGNGLNINSLIEYSHEYDEIEKIQTRLNWDLDKYKLSLLHTHEDRGGDGFKSNYFTGSIRTDFTKNFNAFTSARYDIEEELWRSWIVGYTVSKGCWNYSLKYKHERLPRMQSDGRTKASNKNAVYLTFTFHPIGSFGFDQSSESGS